MRIGEIILLSDSPNELITIDALFHIYLSIFIFVIDERLNIIGCIASVATVRPAVS